MSKLQQDQSEKLREMLDELVSERDHLALLQSLLMHNNVAEFAEIKGLYAAGEALTKKVEEITASIKTKNADLMNEIARAEKGLERKTEGVKDFCHNLPPETLEQSFLFDQGQVLVKVSQAQFLTSYKTEELLENHPELEEISVDGDPVVGRVVFPEVLDRLVAGGQVKIQDIERYRVHAKLRNPSVSVKFKMPGEG